LDGSSIPDHLVPQHPGKITMKVGFSAHADLTIRSQSARSRYTGDGSIRAVGSVLCCRVCRVMLSGLSCYARAVSCTALSIALLEALEAP
jgi:hypothetical protein